MMTPMLRCVTVALLYASKASPLPTTVRLERNVLTMAETGKVKNFYSTKITVGQPAQEFHVAFDLGGGTTMLPSASCRDAACLERQRYDKWSSDSALDIQADGRLVDPSATKVHERMKGRDKGSMEVLSTDLGSGKVVGNFVRDRMCIGAAGKERCFPLALLVAYSMSDVPFGVEPYDGTIGLSLKGMSVSPEFNFLDALARGHQSALPNSFGLHLGTDNGGEITFGGYDVKKWSKPLEWVSVEDPDEGRWQVAITAIRVGNHTLQACRSGDCRAAIDYGTSLLSTPSKLAASIEQAFESLAVPSGHGNGCQMNVMPDLQIVLKNDVTLTLPAEDYVRQISSSGNKGILSGPSRSCKPLLAQYDFDDATMGRDTFVLGESVLRRYYTFFDGDSLQVGFSLAADSKKGKLTLLEAGKGKEWLTAPDDEEDGEDGQTGLILLVQVKLHRSKTRSSLGL